jgi:TRAP-type C4-dicarboxylate transport system permease small subunit
VALLETERQDSIFKRIGSVFDMAVARAGSGFASVTSLATVIMIATGTADVVGTKLFDKPVPATYESTEALMVALVFGGLAFAQRQKRHVRVEFLIQRFSSKTRKVLDLLGLIAGLAFFCLFTWVAWKFFYRSWLDGETESSGIQFPIYPAKFIMFAGALLITLQLWIDTIKDFVRLFGRGDASA